MRGIIQIERIHKNKRNKSARYIVVSGILFVVCQIVLFNICYAQDIETTFASAQLDIEPQIALQADTPTIHISDPGTAGDFDVTVDFTVEANTKHVSMFVEATNFYFFADPTGQQIQPIYLVESTGAEIDPQGATPDTGNIASYTGDGDTIDGYPSRKTETLSFQSSADYTFSHPVAVTVIWNLEPMKPAGEYSAKVKLTCIAMPSDPI